MAALHLIRNHPREFWTGLPVMAAFAGVFSLVWSILP